MKDDDEERDTFGGDSASPPPNGSAGTTTANGSSSAGGGGSEQQQEGRRRGKRRRLALRKAFSVTASEVTELQDDPSVWEALAPVYMKRCFSSLAYMFYRVSEAEEGSQEAVTFLGEARGRMEELVKEVQSSFVASEMSGLAQELADLGKHESWQEAQAPDPVGGTRLPRLFAQRTIDRMSALCRLLPRPEWSGEDVSRGLSEAVVVFLSTIEGLAVKEGSSGPQSLSLTSTGMSGVPPSHRRRSDAFLMATAGGGGGRAKEMGRGSISGKGAGLLGVEGLSRTRQLLCQLGNCLQVDEVILPELWQTAKSLFGEDVTDGLIDDRNTTRAMQNEVMTKYLVFKYNELKLYIRSGWWGLDNQRQRHKKTLSKTSKGSTTQKQADMQSQLAKSMLRTRRSLSNVMSQGGVGGINVSGVDDDSYRVPIGQQRRNIRQALNLGSHRTSAPSSAVSHSEGSGGSGSRGGAGGGSGSGAVDPAASGQFVSNNAQAKVPTYLAKVLMSLVQTRLEAQESLGNLLYQKASRKDREGGGGKHSKRDSMQRKKGSAGGKEELTETKEKSSSSSSRPILYSTYVLRESFRQAMEIVCDCANARVAGQGNLGNKPIDGKDLREQAEKIAEVEFLRDTLWKYLPSSTGERVSRVLARLAKGSFSKMAADAAAAGGDSGKAAAAAAADKHAKPVNTSDTIPTAGMTGTFLRASELKELSRVYVVCLK